MIEDHGFSAGVERTRKSLRRSIRCLVTLALGGALSLAPLAAHGMDHPHLGRTVSGAFEGIALPPIPYTGSMPWLNWQPPAGAMKLDALHSPVFGPPGIKLDLTPPHGDPQLPVMS